MSMVTPTISTNYADNPCLFHTNFEEDFYLNFNVSGGDKVVGSIIRFYDTVNKEIMYEHTHMSEEYTHYIPKDTFENGWYLYIRLSTIGEDGTESEPCIITNYSGEKSYDFLRPTIELENDIPSVLHSNKLTISIKQNNYKSHINGSEEEYDIKLQELRVIMYDGYNEIGMVDNGCINNAYSYRPDDFDSDDILKYSFGELRGGKEYTIFIRETAWTYKTFMYHFTVPLEEEFSRYENLLNVEMDENSGSINLYSAIVDISVNSSGYSCYYGDYYGYGTNSFKIGTQKKEYGYSENDGYFLKNVLSSADNPQLDYSLNDVPYYEYCPAESKYGRYSINENFFAEIIFSPNKELEHLSYSHPFYGWNNICRFNIGNLTCYLKLGRTLKNTYIATMTVAYSSEILGFYVSSELQELKMDSKCVVFVSNDNGNLKIELKKIEEGTIDFTDRTSYGVMQPFNITEENYKMYTKYGNEISEISFYSFKFYSIYFSEDNSKPFIVEKREWDRTCKLHNNFDGYINGGSIKLKYYNSYNQYPKKEVSKLEIIRTTNGNSEIIMSKDARIDSWKNRMALPIIDYKDFGAKPNSKLKYTLKLYFNDDTVYTEEKEIDFKFDSVIVANKTKKFNLFANVVYGNTARNNSISTYNTLNRKYPIIQKSSELNYNTGSLSATILGYNFDCNNRNTFDREDANKQANDLCQFLLNDKAKVIKDWNGNSFLVKFTSANISYVSSYGNSVPTVSANWTEVGDSSNYDDLIKYEIV